jgi:hypothetical protein
VTHHGRVELINGIGLPAYRGVITVETHDAALAALDDDFAQGRYRQADPLWRATLKRAADLSREHTATLGFEGQGPNHPLPAPRPGSARNAPKLAKHNCRNSSLNRPSAITRFQ